MCHMTDHDRNDLIRLLQAGGPISANWQAKPFPGGAQRVEM